MPGIIAQHRPTRNGRRHTTKQSGHQRGYNWRWRRARLPFLAANPLCVFCKREGKTKAANVVDHIKPHKGNMSIFWDVNNWQPLCSKCHDNEKRQQERVDDRVGIHSG